jgi:hypothetical protein
VRTLELAHILLREPASTSPEYAPAGITGALFSFACNPPPPVLWLKS